MLDTSEIYTSWKLNLTDSSYYLGVAFAGALAAIIWEVCIRFDDEIEFIWPKPNRSFIKWLYFLTRYMVLLATIGFRILSIYIFENTATLYQCRSLWTGQAVVVQMAIMCTDITLMLRVYALYNRSRRIGLILLSALVVENVIQAFSMSIFIPTLPFHEFCFIKHIPASLFYYGYSTVLTQVVILGLTLVKHSFVRREGWGRTPVVSLVLRDGSYVFFTVSVIMIVAMIYTVFGYSFAVHVYWWFVGILSSSGSRLIINMQRLAMPPGLESPEFTTNITAPMSVTENTSNNMSTYFVSDTVNWSERPSLYDERPSFIE